MLRIIPKGESETAGPYKEDDAAEDTDSSIGEVSEAGHSARNDAEQAEEIVRGSAPGESHPDDDDVEAYSYEDLQELILERDEQESDRENDD